MYKENTRTPSNQQSSVDKAKSHRLAHAIRAKLIYRTTFPEAQPQENPAAASGLLRAFV
jgi:hypothetical protein